MACGPLRFWILDRIGFASLPDRKAAGSIDSRWSTPSEVGHAAPPTSLRSPPPPLRGRRRNQARVDGVVLSRLPGEVAEAEG